MNPPCLTSAAGTSEAFILAGGRSSRMGKDKALIELAGKPLVQHAVDTLAALGQTHRIAGARTDLSAFTPVVEDESGGDLGPLCGICAALNASAAQFAVFLPVDLPFMPGKLIRYLLHHAGITHSSFTLISLAGFVQTFPVVIARQALPLLQESLHSPDRNCLRAFRNAAGRINEPLAVLPVEHLLQAGQVSHPQGLVPAAWFLNINFPHDLSRAENLLSRHLQVS